MSPGYGVDAEKSVIHTGVVFKIGYGHQGGMLFPVIFHFHFEYGPKTLVLT
jgi:hypothetical protein